MRVGIDFKAIILGWIAVLATAGVFAGYAWLEHAPDGPSGWSGSQLFLLLFAPVVAAVGGFGVVRGFIGVSRGATRYVLSDRELVVRYPLWTRRHSWTSVRDFLLPPANFPRAPRFLVLLFADNRPVPLPLRRIRAAGAAELLIASVPGLADWGVERVRTAKPTTLSPLRTRWRLYKADIFALYAAPIVLLLMVAGGILVGRNFIDYLRIDFSHDTARARIINITRDSGIREESVWTRVQFTAWSGQTIRLHRKVIVRFADRFHVGDSVTVEYLHDHPGIGRIAGWDLDSRQWILLLLLLPMIWFLYRGTRRIMAEWVGPLREHAIWGAKSGSLHLAFSSASLDTLYPLLPQEHVGTLVLKPPMASSKKPGLGPWFRWITRAGLLARKALGTFIILEPDQARRALDRLGGDNPFVGDYLVLNSATADDAERFLTEELPHLTPDSTGSEAARVRVYLQNKGVGPLDDPRKLALFQNWITQRLARLYGGALPPHLPETDFARLFGIDPLAGLHEMLFERRRQTPRIWLGTQAQPPLAQLAQCQHGRWTVVGKLPPPAPLRRPRSQAKRTIAPTGGNRPRLLV